ncbi:MAG: hypothetical protein UY04_C0043G0002 [Parcubacteria group bacterium GW2011_GWA2_47_7]|nr:MAG: hypothetical protein UY04_C0043G0002 [Parcubacteria group bacterium GW2011_GWA2_47_7]
MYQAISFAAPAGAALLLTALLFRGVRTTIATYFAAGHNVETVQGAGTIAAAWIWVVALFFIPWICYQQGLIAFIPFVLCNALVLVGLAFLAPRILEVMPQGYTLPGYIGKRDGIMMEALVAVITVAAMAYIALLPLQAASNLVVYLSGWDRDTVILALAALIFIVACPRGLISSIATDIVKLAAVIIIVGLAAVAIAVALEKEGAGVLVRGLNGIRPPEAELFPLGLLLTFVLPSAINLFASGAMDGMLYQRLFAVRKVNVRRAFLWGAGIFLFVPLIMGTVGLLVAGLFGNLQLKPGSVEADLIAFTTIVKLVPQVPHILFATILIGAILATAVAALNAASTVAVNNFIRPLTLWWSGEDLTDVKAIGIAWGVMLLVLLLATTGARAQWDLFTWWLTAGAIRAVLLVPIVALILTSPVFLRSAVWWVVVTAIVSTLTYLLATETLVASNSGLSFYGEVLSTVPVSVHRVGVSYASIAAITTGLLCWGSMWIYRLSKT